MEALVSVLVGVSVAFTAYNWYRAPKGRLHAGSEAQPPVVKDDGHAQGNFPPPGKRAARAPNNYGLEGDRWLDWFAIIILFGGFLYAIYLGSTPAGKYV